MPVFELYLSQLLSLKITKKTYRAAYFTEVTQGQTVADCSCSRFLFGGMNSLSPNQSDEGMDTVKNGK